MQAIIAAVAAALLLAGCAQDSASAARHGTDPSMPGVEVQAHASADKEVLKVWATAWNNGTTTWKVDHFCQSPWGLGIEAQGKGYSEVQCLAYSEPIDWHPGEDLPFERTIRRADYDWGAQTATVTLTFNQADGPAAVTVRLEVKLP